MTKEQLQKIRDYLGSYQSALYNVLYDRYSPLELEKELNELDELIGALDREL